MATLGVELEAHGASSPDLSRVQILVVHSGVRVDAAHMEAAPDLRLRLTTTSGSDHLDLKAAHERGIVVGRCPLARRDAVVDTAMAMGLSLLRQLPSLHDRARAGLWARGELPERGPKRIAGLPVGIVGAGVIGQAAIRQWSALGAEVQFHDPAVEGSTPLEDLLEASAILSLHCSLTDSSRGLINARRLSIMPKGSILLNTARGACVDLDALSQAAHLGGLGLDVFAEEPPVELAQLATRDNVILSPHAAGFHPCMAEHVCEELVAAVRAWLAGEPLPAQLCPPLST
jgi:phosphoglycerate dehydrogenase-like enzyme